MKKKTITIIFIISLFALFTTCKKDFETPTGSNKIEFENITVDSVSYSWVQLTTQFTNTGGNNIPQHGYCWSTGQEPTIENDKTSLGKLQEPKCFIGNRYHHQKRIHKFQENRTDCLSCNKNS